MAVSNPIVGVLADISLSIVLGTPTTFIPCSCITRAESRVPSPPTIIIPSTPIFLSAAIPSSTRSTNIVLSSSLG
ncbi:hypothetical protein D3C76_1650410 [compost metagenome]